MGRCHAYSCSKCGYLAKVSGGEDRGRDVFTRTMHCLDCQSLYDGVSHVRQARPAGLSGGPQTPAAMRRLWAGITFPRHATGSEVVRGIGVRRLDAQLPAGQRSRWVAFKLACPRSAHHRVERWNHPGRCPKCATHLDRSLVPCLVWD